MKRNSELNEIYKDQFLVVAFGRKEDLAILALPCYPNAGTCYLIAEMIVLI